MKRPKSKMIARILLISSFFTIIMSAAACAPSPEYPEGHSRVIASKDGEGSFGDLTPIFVIDHEDYHGITEIYQVSPTLLYAIDPGGERNANAISIIEKKAVMQKLLSEGYVVRSIEEIGSVLAISLAGDENTADATRGKDRVIILPEGILDILGE